MIVREVRQNNWRRGLYPLGFYTISATAGSVAHLDFGNSLTALVTGTVFHDLNRSGTQQAGEAGLAGWLVEGDFLSNGVWQNNKFHTTTDVHGAYTLILSAGTYRIHVVSQGALHPTKPAGGTTSLPITSGATLTDVNFGED